MLMALRWYVATTIGLAAVGAALATEAHYECAGGARVDAQFSPPDAAKGQVALSVEGSGSRTVLPQARSADGGRYAGDGIEFWIKGKSATLTRSGASENCTTD
jgi:membrane-bound inhibitor of C-type lysozyme